MQVTRPRKIAFIIIMHSLMRRRTLMHKLVLAYGLAFAVTSPAFAQDKIIERLGPVEVNEPVLGNIGPNPPPWPYAVALAQSQSPLLSASTRLGGQKGSGKKLWYQHS